jgi:hypothetical protein
MRFYEFVSLPNKIELGYNVMSRTEYFVSL